MADSGSMMHYRKHTCCADMTGEQYEIYICMLLFIRSKMQTHEFRLATNMATAGVFDDIVLSLKDKKTKEEKTYLIQIKHKRKKSIIDHRALSALKGDFSLFKYFRSYLEIKKNFPNDNNVFVIYTNVEMKSSGCASHDDDLLNSGGKIFTFTQQSEEYSAFKQLETYRNVIQDISDGNYTEQQIRSKVEKFEGFVPSNRLLRLIDDKEKLKMEIEQQTKEWTWGMWDEFMKNLKFYTEQSSLKKIETLVKNDLEKLCGTSEMFFELKNGIMTWWRESYFYLTETATPFWENILQQHASELMVTVSDKLSSVSGLKFQQTQYLSFTSKITHVICRGSTELSCLKVKQSLSDVKHLFIDKDVLQKCLREVLFLWDHFHILIVDGCSTEINMEIFNQLSSVLHTDQDKKIIFVSDNTDLMAVRLSKLFSSTSFTDVFNISQLTIDSQDTVLNCEVEFQGKLVKLRTIVVDPEVVTADVTIQLLKKRKRIQIGCELPSVDDTYVSRTLLRHEIVCKKVFELIETDCIAFSGIALSEVIAILPENAVVQEFTDVDEINTKCRYFIIDGMSSFKSLCEKRDKVHWLEKKGNSFVWRKSSGDITLIKDNLEQNSVQYESIFQALEILEQLVLVVADPGMGKTTEVTHLATMYKDKDPSMWVLNVVMSNHAVILENSAVTAVELLCEAGNLKTIFERSLFERELFQRGNILIILDGCDETSPRVFEKIIGMVKEITCTNVGKICVTSRPVMQVDLEKELSTLAFSINPLSRQNQLELLKKMWMVPKSSSADMMKFASALLDSSTKLINDSSGNMMGTPLHCKMISQLFEKEAKEYSISGIYHFPEYFDLLKMYELFVDYKFEVYFDKINLNMGNFMVLSMAQDIKRKLIRDITLCALFARLSDDEFEKLPNSKDLQHRYLDKYEFKQNLALTGIIQVTMQNKPVFVHRSIEEYFVALWLSKNYHENRDLIVEKLFDPDWQVIKLFLDRILCATFKLHIAVLNQDLSLVQHLLASKDTEVNERDVAGRTALHLTVSFKNKDECEVHQKMLTMLLHHGANPNIEDDLCKWRPLMYAEKLRLWSAVEILMENGADKSDLDVIIKNFNDRKYVDDLLKSSATRMDHILEFVLAACDDGGNTLLHYVAEQGNLNAASILLKHNVDINVKNKKMETPAELAFKHNRMEVLELLKDHGADLTVCTFTRS